MITINKPRRKFRKGEEVWYDGNPYTVYDASFRNGEWVYNIANDEEGLASFGVPEDELNGNSKEKPTSKSKFRKGQTVWYDGVPCTIDDVKFIHGEWRYNVSNDDEQVASFGATEDELTPVSESTMRKPTMKKLPITKEQFNKSRYFKNKYGRLEYVSESGKVFKTDKGKVLMFKESASKGFEKFYEELKSKFSDIDGVKIYMMDNEDGTYTITVTIRRFDDERSVWYPEDVKKIGQFIKRKCDRFGWAVEKNVEYRLGLTDFYITETESTNESAKESGRKFSESTSIEQEVWDKWERMSDEIESALNFDFVAQNVANKYFPRHADKIANWLKYNIDLICTDGYVEDWTEMKNCLESFTRDNDIQKSDLA